MLESNNALDTTTQRWNKLKRECGGNSERNLKMCHAEIKVIMFDYLYYNAKTQIKFTISRKDSNRVIFIDYYVGASVAEAERQLISWRYSQNIYKLI